MVASSLSKVAKSCAACCRPACGGPPWRRLGALGRSHRIARFLGRLIGVGEHQLAPSLAHEVPPGSRTRAAGRRRGAECVGPSTDLRRRPLTEAPACPRRQSISGAAQTARGDPAETQPRPSRDPAHRVTLDAKRSNAVSRGEWAAYEALLVVGIAPSGSETSACLQPSPPIPVPPLVRSTASPFAAESAVSKSQIRYSALEQAPRKHGHAREERPIPDARAQTA